jgi:recombination protein RecR
LTIESLVARVASGDVKEVILGLSPTMEGDTTAFYLTKKLADYSIKISTIARGIPIGGDLEYTDEITLGRSIVGRLFMNSIKQINETQSNFCKVHSLF